MKVESALDVKPLAVRWLWRGRIPLGMFALIAGREGEGKSSNAYEMLARVTKGELDGELKGEPRAVIIAASEDSWEHTVVPRLIAARADLSLVFRVRVRLTDLGYDKQLCLPDDVQALEAAIEDKKAALVLLDPVISRISRKLDTHKDQEVRQGLEPLVALADRTGCAFLGVIHLNKNSDQRPADGGDGVAGVRRRGARRAVRHPGRSQQAAPLPRQVQPRPRAELGGVQHRPGDGRRGPTGRAPRHGLVRSVEGETETSARQALESMSRGESPATRAESWLAKRLAGAGAVPSATLKKEAAEAGFSESTLKRAAKAIGITVHPAEVGVKGAGSTWEESDALGSPFE